MSEKSLSPDEQSTLSLLSKGNKERCRTSLMAYCTYVRDFQNNWHHNEWAEILDDRAFQYGDIIYYNDDDQWIVDNKWIMIMAPRSHAKSTEITVSYSLQSIGKNPNVRIVIVSSSMSQSTSFLREITQELERNDKHKEVFGNQVPVIPEKWTQHEIIVDRSNNKLKDPTVSATSIGGTVINYIAILESSIV